MNDYATTTLSERQAGGTSLDEEIKRGIAASEAGDKPAAEAIFRQIVAAHPDALEAWIWLGWTSADLNDSDAAFSRAAALDPKNEEAQLGLRWVASQRGSTPVEMEPQPEMSRMPETPAYSDSSESAPEAAAKSETPEGTPEGWDFDKEMKRAVRLARHGDKVSAYSMFRTIAERNPNSATVWVWYGGTSPYLEDAEAAFKRALELDPANEEAHLGLRWVALRRRVIETTGPLATSTGPIARPEGTTGPVATETVPVGSTAPTAKVEASEKGSFFAALLKKLNISLPVLLMILAVVVVWAAVAVWYLTSNR